MAIPTKYRGVNFRSRLEAKWAAFFDLVRWDWTYEPFDLNGYIPDFVVQFKKPVLFEVKGVSTFEELRPHYRKIAESGWMNESVLVCGYVGANGREFGLVDDNWCCERRGQSSDEATKAGEHLLDASLVECSACKAISFFSYIGANHCRLNDCYKTMSDVDPTPLWAEAGNMVQWKGRRA